MVGIGGDSIYCSRTVTNRVLRLGRDLFQFATGDDRNVLGWIDIALHVILDNWVILDNRVTTDGGVVGGIISSHTHLCLPGTLACQLGLLDSSPKGDWDWSGPTRTGWHTKIT
jgi:hypothetical protein